MPTYLFTRLSDDEPVTRFFTTRLRPHIGDVVEIDGEPCRRVVSIGSLSSKANQLAHPKYPRADHSLPRQQWWPAADKSKTQFTKTGRPIIRSRAHESEVAAALDLKRLT